MGSMTGLKTNEPATINYRYNLLIHLIAGAPASGIRCRGAFSLPIPIVPDWQNLKSEAHKTFYLLPRLRILL
jgi:hypothetical protein